MGGRVWTLDEYDDEEEEEALIVREPESDPSWSWYEVACCHGSPVEGLEGKEEGSAAMMMELILSEDP